MGLLDWLKAPPPYDDEDVPEFRALDIMAAPYSNEERSRTEEFRQRLDAVAALVAENPTNFQLRVTYANCVAGVDRGAAYENLLAASLLAKRDRHQLALVRLAWSRLNRDQADAVGEAAGIEDLRQPENSD